MDNIAIQSLKQILTKMKASFTFFIFLFVFLPGYAEDKSQIGQIIVTVGKVKAIRSDKTERFLKRGDPFYPLEVIAVDAESKAQLKFIDGGIMNLIAQTEFRVDSYVFNKPNKVSEFLGTLIKGGFRAASGAIAKENPTGTKVITPLSTIGLRGTIYEAIFHNGKVSVGCEEGKIAVINDKGEVVIGPTSNTLYAIVIVGEAPLPSIKKPSDLASASFEIEGGEPFSAKPGTVPHVRSQPYPLQGPRESYMPQMNYPQEFQQYYPSKGEYPQSRTRQDMYQGYEKSYPGYERSYQSPGKDYQNRSQGSQGSSGKYQTPVKTYQSSSQEYKESRDYQSYQGKRQYDKNYDKDRGQKYPGDYQRTQQKDSHEIDRSYPSGKGSYQDGGGGFPISPFL